VSYNNVGRTFFGFLAIAFDRQTYGRTSGSWLYRISLQSHGGSQLRRQHI